LTQVQNLSVLNVIVTFSHRLEDKAVFHAFK